ncbi:CRISPR-associated endonuclease Cas3'', partial [bacterium]|nr:CRISPR-associated endonuclease Cas3'' [bacterium]
MKFYSHSTKENDKIIGTKEIKDHLNQVLKLAIESLNKTSFSDLYSSSIEDIIKYTCLFHDLGKYTSYFQDYLLKENDTGSLRYHSDISAIFAFNYLKYSNVFNNDKRSYFPFWVYYLIKHHHLSLKSLKDQNLFGNNPAGFKNNYQLKRNNLINNNDLISDEFSIQNISNFLDLPLEEDIINRANWLKGREKNIENYFYVLYCFSLLIEADKLNASGTEVYLPKKIPVERLDKYLEGKNKTKKQINTDRNEVRALVCSEENINKIIEKKGIYTLTAPTGIGKTLTSLNLALELKKRLDEKGQNTQIIYCLPFINIIEQTSKEFEALFSDITILKHHQYSDIFSKKEENENTNSIENKLMELECWQGDLIITTFVQFLHTIIGNKNKLLKKFHHLSNSIIILDEVQAINIQYWPLIGAVLHYLVKFLNSKIILMTATKPLIIESTKKYLLQN